VHGVARPYPAQPHLRHAAGELRLQATATLWNGYPADIKAWINQRGGLKREFVWMRAPDVYRFFRRC
jgi:hypothetical protein